MAEGSTNGNHEGLSLPVKDGDTNHQTSSSYLTIPFMQKVSFCLSFSFSLFASLFASLMLTILYLQHSGLILQDNFLNIYLADIFEYINKILYITVLSNISSVQKKNRSNHAKDDYYYYSVIMR